MGTSHGPVAGVPARLTTVRDVLGSLAGDPRCWLREWNWKAALTSALSRSGVFFAANLSAGLEAAVAALVTELALRAITSGFYGSLTARFRHVEPRWQATLCAVVLLPCCSHSVELAVHWWRGTAALATGIAASALFTVLSTAFNLHLMRHGILIVGDGARSLGDDLRAMPRLLLRFVAG